MNDIKPIQELLRAARVYAAERVEWLAPALYAAAPVISDELPAPAAIDRFGRVYFNPRWLERLQGDVLAQVGFLWAHEVWHWLREHGLRREELRAEPSLWNLACDLEINDYVPDGLQMPDFGGGVSGATPQLYGLPAGKLAEWYYRELRERGQGQQKKARTGMSVPQAGEGTARTGISVPQAGEGAARTGMSVLREWDEGSGVHGQARAWELPAESEEAHTLGDFDRHSLREEVAKRVLEAQKTRGTLPAGMVRWAEETLRPRVNWREQLKRVVRGAISEGFGQRLDYSLRRPNRRSEVYAPLIVPALQGEYRPRVAVVVDTSGSIGERELAQAMAEVRAVLEQLRTRITIIPCDAVPYEAVQVLTRRDWEVARGKLKGGGGTDMPAGVEAAKRLKPPPDAILVLTDGYTPFPDKPPQPKEPAVLWGIWKLGDESPPKPPCPPWRARDIVEIPIE
jgi:predicted metal-dependent peptidase